MFNDYVNSYIRDVFEDLYLEILEPYMERNVDGSRKQGYRQTLKKWQRKKRTFVRGLRRKTAEEQVAAAMEYKSYQNGDNAYENGGVDGQYLDKRMRPSKR